MIQRSLLLFILASALLFSSCYRMPTDEDFSLVPTTNNPAITCEKNDSPLPGIKL